MHLFDETNTSPAERVSQAKRAVDMVDQRRDAIVQRDLQSIANNSQRVKHVAQLQARADQFATTLQRRPRFTIGGQLGNRMPVQRVDSDDEQEVPDVDPSSHAEFDAAAHNEFLKNPIYQAWVASILLEGSVNVSTCSNDPYGPRACWNAHHRQILIRQETLPSPRRASMMAFEVTNALQEHRFAELKTRAMAGFFSGKAHPDTLYAHESESIEYDGLVLHHTMMQWGIVNLRWPAELDTYGKKLSAQWSTLQGYLATQEKSGHTNFARSNYNNTLDPGRV
jgi:hypothetical protein